MNDFVKLRIFVINIRSIKIVKIDEESWALDTKWAYGMIISKNGIVVRGAPIFKNLIGEPIEKLKKIYKLENLGDFLGEETS